MYNQRASFISKYLRKTFEPRQNYLWKYFSRSLSAHATSGRERPSYLHNVGRQPLTYRNIGQQIQLSAIDFCNVEAIVSCHENKRITFATLLDFVDRVAAGLLKLGLQRGDHVGIWGPNNLHWYLTMLGAARAGLVSVGINPAFQGPEVEYCLKKVDIKAIVAADYHKTQNYYEILTSICPELTVSKNGNIRSSRLPHLRSVIIDSPFAYKGTMTFDQLLDYGSREDVIDVASRVEQISPDASCNVQFTSGTTGKPKAACISHFSLVNNGIHIGTRNQLNGQRICVQVPLFHAYGTAITIMAALCHGATLVLPTAGFNPKDSLHAIIDEGCTVIHGTPTMYVDLIKTQKELQLPLKTAKVAITGGACCSPQLILDIKNILGPEHVRNVFGLTESTAIIFQSRPGDTEEQMLNTVGYIQDHIEAKVIDSFGNTVPFGQPGELCVRGYITMLGYHGDEEKTKETIGADKWLRTGDQFVLQADGYGCIVGRLKEMIIRGGENIFPREVEDFLNTHPNILETHVIGVPDNRMGEELCAFVRLTEKKGNISHEEVKQFCKGKLAHFKVPRYVVVVAEFPKTTSGKIQKFKLLENFIKNKK